MHNQGFNASGLSGFNYGSIASRVYRKKEPSTDQLMEGLGSKIETIPLPSEAGQPPSISIQDLKVVTSYSWLDATTPTILVPGSPPIWQGRTMPYTVPRDTGVVYIDHNAARLSSSPLFPLIAAVSHYAPDFPLPSVDFVTDRNGLRKLCRWASGDPKAGTFRIDIDRVGKKTVLMQRWETEMTQWGGPGYEREFERASTTPGAGSEGTTGHHRIVTYDLGGLKMLVRFKCDACLSKKAPGGAQSQSVKHDPLDTLTASLQKLTVKTSSSGSTTMKIPALKGASLTLLTRGTLVPQADLLELKTRSIRSVGGFDWDDTYTQLLLSQTPNIFLCVHERGKFLEVRKKKLEEIETEEMARKVQKSLKKLRKVLGAIQAMIKEKGDGVKLSLVCKPGAEMIVYKRTTQETCLPQEILDKFQAQKLPEKTGVISASD